MNQNANCENEITPQVLEENMGGFSWVREKSFYDSNHVQTQGSGYPPMQLREGCGAALSLT